MALHGGAKATVMAAIFALLALAAVSRANDMREVTIGSAVKLQHDRLKMYLHSHDVNYGSGSGQQSVTGFPGGDDANSYWIVRCAIKAKDCHQGKTVKDGFVIRLQHMKTRKWLHSHLHASPLSNNQEVSAYGDENTSDTGDHWKVEIEGKGIVWLRDQKVRLMHVDTSTLLHSHDMKYPRPIAGQHEVCAIQMKNSNNLWVATQGVYLPVVN